MNVTQTILSLECGLLAVFLLLVVGALITYKFSSRHGSNDSGPEKKYILLPRTSAKCVQLEKNIKQLAGGNMENHGATDDCTVIDETINRADTGRIYFSLKYDDARSLLMVKLIKGENLPMISPDASKAYIKVQMICQQTDSKPSTAEVKKSISTNYQRTYRFCVSREDFASHIIYFEISRFDRFSRKYDVGYVFITLAELQAQGVDFRREAFCTKDITCPSFRKVQRQKPQVLWNKLSHAVHTGFFHELRRNRNESLQWDPFLIVQRYENQDSDDSSRHKNNNHYSPEYRKHDVERPAFDEEGSSEVESPEWLSRCVIHSSSERQTELSPDNTAQERVPLNQDYYRLVHSPPLVRRTPTDAITSWSIPETFQFSPSPSLTKKSTVVFHSASSIRTARQDRLHKLTSLSSSYREKILRKSRRKTAFGRGRLTGKISLHESLYLGKETQHSKFAADERTHKRQRKIS